MTPAELRNRAKALRAEAANLIKQADDIEQREAYMRRVEASREAAEARFATACRPVWIRPPDEHLYVVEDVSAGFFTLRRVWPGGSPPVVRLYSVRGGIAKLDPRHYDHDLILSRLDSTRTMEAWRAWCAARKAAGGVP